jgi:hypothetical protein
MLIAEEEEEEEKEGGLNPSYASKPSLSLFWDCSRTFPLTFGARNSSSSYCCGS